AAGEEGVAWCGAEEQAVNRNEIATSRAAVISPLGLSVVQGRSIVRAGDERRQALAGREDLQRIQVGGVASGRRVDPDAVHAAGLERDGDGGGMQLAPAAGETGEVIDLGQLGAIDLE